MARALAVELGPIRVNAVSPGSIRKACDEEDTVGALLPDFWKDLCALGWLGLHVPEQYGGGGLSFSSASSLRSAATIGNDASIAFAPRRLGRLPSPRRHGIHMPLVGFRPTKARLIIDDSNDTVLVMKVVMSDSESVEFATGGKLDLLADQPDNLNFSAGLVARRHRQVACATHYGVTPPPSNAVPHPYPPQQSARRRAPAESLYTRRSIPDRH